MQDLFRLAMIALTASLGFAQLPQGYKAARLAGTQHPDINGIWQAVNSANYDIEPHAASPSPFPRLSGTIGAEPAGLGVVEGGTIPYQPWAAAKKKENFEKRLAHPTTNDLNDTTG